MNSNVRYKYYEYYIDNADDVKLDSLKEDITNDKNSNTLDLPHYLKLSRAIAKRKKSINKQNLA